MIVFEHFGEAMPVVYPRAQCTLTGVKLNKLMAKFGFEIEVPWGLYRIGSRRPVHEYSQELRVSEIPSPGLNFTVHQFHPTAN